GSVSRKMHLHARRLVIDHPGGDKLDVTAALPEHFAATMEQLGFDSAASDAAPTEGPPPPSKEAKKQKARAHAKQARKARPSRRGRGAAKAGPAKGGKRW
ncbi:MAG: RluA family pseudouridine synthase, partial [Tsuneonella sp.]